MAEEVVPEHAGPSVWRVFKRRPGAVLRSLGPGLIAGASDNDPTTVATLAVIGSTTGFGLAWLVILIIPMLVVVQVISAAIGSISREGLEDVIRVRYGRGWAYLALLAVLAVNVLTLAADLEGGSAALAPLAGKAASLVFGLGLLASAVIAVPVLAGTSAYVIAQATDRQGNLDARFGQARSFYLALLASLAAGVTFLGIGPIRLLFYGSIAGGLGTPVTLAMMLLAARDKKVMGEHRVGRGLAVGGWIVFAVVARASAIYLWQTFV
jgi:Mn2+/Fe2+ NRAMP family transporter